MSSYTMQTREEILEQISALNCRLRELTPSEIDPEFTPLELVRWDNTLIGSLLHVEHSSKLQRNLLGALKNVSNDLLVEQFGVLTSNGIILADTIVSENLVFSTRNTFSSLTQIPVSYTGNPIELENICKINEIDMRLLTKTTNMYGVSSYTQGFIPLVPPTQNILDAIHIASYVKIPCHEREFVVDQYPLIHLYEEWKLDKILGRKKRYAPLQTTDSANPTNQVISSNTEEDERMSKILDP